MTDQDRDTIAQTAIAQAKADRQERQDQNINAIAQQIFGTEIPASEPSLSRFYVTIERLEGETRHTAAREIRAWSALDAGSRMCDLWAVNRDEIQILTITRMRD